MDIEKLYALAERINKFNKGGKIHINPANRGKFNATKARTGKTTEELTHSKNPLTRKRAIFAQNAAKWNHKHADGGLLRLFDDGGDTNDEYYDFLPASIVTAKLPSINTGDGKRIAKNLAERVAHGEISLSDVPYRYKSYVEGEVMGAIPVRNAINTTGVKTALGTLAVPAGIIAGVELGAGIATNPMLKKAFDVVGSVDGIRNAASDNGVKKTARLISEGKYGRAVLSGLGDVFDIIGGVGLARDVFRYGRGVAKRGAEAVLRMGDAATNIPDLKRQFGNKRTLNYVFNPFANGELAYGLPFRYSGESAIQDVFTRAHVGDIIDQYLGKVDVPNATYDTSTLPEYLQKYIAKNYPGKKIPIRDLGNAGDICQEVIEPFPGAYLSGDSPSIFKDGIPVLDPGGFVSQVVDRVPVGDGYDSVTLKNWDIWKFNDKDYVSRHSSAVGPKDMVRRIGLKFLDSQGTPIVHTWTSNGGYAVSPEVVNPRKLNYADGGPLPYEEWYKTVPKEKNDTTSYNLRRAYELAPKEQLDAFVNSDEHLYSSYKNPKTGEYEFMKSATHPSLLWELAAYNSEKDFHRRYGIVPDGMFLKYVSYADGGPLEYDFSQGFLYPAPDSLATNLRAASVPVQETVQTPAPIDYDELKRRQYYLESKFNDKAVNRHSGAMGAYQIMPITLKDYTQRTGETGDLNDYAFNEKVRDYYMNRHLNSSWATKNNQSEYNRVAKALAAYNWGPGNLLNYLNGQKASGVDIYQGTDWIKGLPGETRNYISWILDGKDIGNRTTNAGYEKAKKRRFDFGGYVSELVRTHGGSDQILKAIKRLKEKNL